jgi:hypothetical protein
VDRQLVVAQSVTTLRLRAGSDQSANEVRLGMIREVPARQLIVGQHLLLQIESIQRAPLAAHFRLQQVIAAEPRQAKRFVRRRLRHVLDQPQRRSQRHAAEADVGDPDLVLEIDLQQHVSARPDRIFRLIHQHACGKARDAEADALERMLEQEIVLVAIAATSLRHQLLLQRADIERHGPVQQRIQVLERDFLRVQAMDLAQRVQLRRRRSAVADAFEIGVEIEPEVHAISLY